MPDEAEELASLSAPPANNGVPKTPEENAEDDEELAKQELSRITPSNEKLIELARKYGPLPEWLDEDEELPFVPLDE